MNITMKTVHFYGCASDFKPPVFREGKIFIPFQSPEVAQSYSDRDNSKFKDCEVSLSSITSDGLYFSADLLSLRNSYDCIEFIFIKSEKLHLPIRASNEKLWGIFLDPKNRVHSLKFEHYDAETRLFVALASANCKELSLSKRIASSTIAIYKFIELGCEGSIDLNISVNQIKEETSALEDSNQVRTDKLQLKLSILTAAWHYAVYRKEFNLVAGYLYEIKSITSEIIEYERNGISKNKLSYSLNIGKGLSLLSYIAYLNDNSDLAIKTTLLLLEYYKLCSSHIDVCPDLNPAFFNDTLDCARSSHLALCISYHLTTGSQKKSVMSRLNHKTFYEKCTRVKSSDRFKKLFYEAFSSYESRCGVLLGGS